MSVPGLIKFSTNMTYFGGELEVIILPYNSFHNRTERCHTEGRKTVRRN
jgi:hypothetical protein